MVQAATRIESCMAVGTTVVSRQIVLNAQSRAAAATNYCLRLPLGEWPNLCIVLGQFSMAKEARKPLFAAMELNGNNVRRTVVVSASRLSIHIDSMDYDISDANFVALRDFIVK